MCRCRVTEASGADLMHVCELQSSRGVGGGPHVRANMGGELFSKLVWRQLLQTMLYSRNVDKENLGTYSLSRYNSALSIHLHDCFIYQNIKAH